jgi:hypothetical protein
MSSNEITKLKDHVHSLVKEVTKISGRVPLLSPTYPPHSPTPPPNYPPDESSIHKLHQAYGYYRDKCLYRETVSLLQPPLHPRRIPRRSLSPQRRHSPSLQLASPRASSPVGNHCQRQDIISLSPDGINAKGRFHALMSAGTHKSVEGSGAVVQW